MEMVVTAAHNGVIGQLVVKEGDSLSGQDLICRVVKP
jgi:pyruvate carboxylase